MLKTIAAFFACERGATAVEYGLIAAILAGVIVGASGSIRSALQVTFTTIGNSVANAN